MDLLESCFPYALIRNAFHAVYKQENAQIPWLMQTSTNSVRFKL